MVKIIRYEVYSDKGDGWKLLDQFSGDERQNASIFAKEIEESGWPVKIIREIFETDDGSFQETVEYIGGLAKKTKQKVVSIEDAIFNDLTGEYNIEATPLKMLAQNEVSKAFAKLFLIIVFSLLLANILISLSVPVVEFLIPDEQRKSVLFFGFFVIFILIAGPLLFYKIPWNVFYSLRKDDKEVINEKIFFKRATNLMNNYNLNDDGKEVITPVYPEAPLEYKQYIVDYLTQLLNNLNSEIRLQDSFNRLGLELVVYGGCLELSRYGHLVWAEANSLLYEAFKILEGENTDLQAFYDAKRTYRDNKVAVFLTGVGAYLMAQIINNIPMDTTVLKITMEKWIASKNIPEIDHKDEVKKEVKHISEQSENDYECTANIRLNVHIFDDENAVSSNTHDMVNSEIRQIISQLATQNKGTDIIEYNDITSIRFSNLSKAVHFVSSIFDELEEYKDKNESYNLMIDAKASVLSIPTDATVNLSEYISDVLDCAYNQEIIVNDAIKDELLDSSYSFEFLGEKNLRKSETVASLYKMNI